MALLAAFALELDDSVGRSSPFTCLAPGFDFGVRAMSHWDSPDRPRLGDIMAQDTVYP